MEAVQTFHVLDRVDSTNNYAMAALHAGLARHGMAWFTREQFAGKGQRGKEWLSEAGQNIIMSVIIAPSPIFAAQPFLFNAFVSNICYDFLKKIIPENVTVKWPNDLYVNDRKAGGMLIENKYSGTKWKWSVVGIGINVNQVVFPKNVANAVSLKQVSGVHYDALLLARELHKMILDATSSGQYILSEIIKTYNEHLFFLNQKVRLRKKNMVFETTITGVNSHGQLLTSDQMPRVFNFGEVEWIFSG